MKTHEMAYLIITEHFSLYFFWWIEWKQYVSLLVTLPLFLFQNCLFCMRKQSDFENDAGNFWLVLLSSHTVTADELERDYYDETCFLIKPGSTSPVSYNPGEIQPV